MTLTASNIQHVFLALMALSVLTECLLTILHTHAAERAATCVPAPFERKLSAAAHRKAADYTGELAQGRLLLVFAGAGIALLLTYGQGLTLLASLAGALSSSALIGEWTVIALVLLLLIIADIPLGWFLRCRIPRRFGYLTENEGLWIAKNFKDALTGWLVALPFIAAAVALFESIGQYWWLLAWFFWTLYLVWRWRIGPNWSILHGRRAKPLRDAKTRAMVKDFLRLQGYEMRDLLVMKRPSGWSHSHLVLCGFGKEKTVVVFAHAAAKLTREELLALIAHDIGHAKHFHAGLRIAIFSLAGLLLAWFTGWGARNDAFFAGFGFSPYVTLARDGAHAGFVIATAIVVFPILFYPLRPLVNLFARAMQYDADAYAVRTVGADALVRALVKLHRDYATTLTPSRLYSIFHYARPHEGMRVAAVEALVAKMKWPSDKPAQAAYPGAPNVFDISGYLEPGEAQPVVMPARRKCPPKREAVTIVEQETSEMQAADTQRDAEPVRIDSTPAAETEAAAQELAPEAADRTTNAPGSLEAALEKTETLDVGKVNVASAEKPDDVAESTLDTDQNTDASGTTAESAASTGAAPMADTSPKAR